MRATTRWVDNLQFVTWGDSKHAIAVDGTAPVGGEDTAIMPKELVLNGLITCTGMDVVSILKKMRVDFYKFEVSAEAEVAPEHPKVFTKIDIEYNIWGFSINEENLDKAIRLSQEKYCGVTAMLLKACPINYSYKIHDSEYGKDNR
ncbi:OsmC family protein [bacterium]|nr:OsmC family protein [bacterium]